MYRMKRNLETKDRLFAKFCAAIVCAAVIFACEYEYVPDNIKSSDNLLVIEGDIIAGDYTYVSIRKAMHIYGSSNDMVYIGNADVWVEDENGRVWQGAKVASGSDDPFSSGTSSSYYPSDGYTSGVVYYAVNTSELDLGGKYKLCVGIGNDRKYESELLPVNISPAIDSITYAEAEDLNSLSLYVTTHSDKSGILYCKWTYEEDWEMKSEFLSNLFFDQNSNTLYEADYSTQQKQYWCYNSASSSDIYVASSEKLSGGVLYKNLLKTIYSSDSRISWMYSINVTQTALDRQGYEYWKMLKKNADETGGLFGAQPSDMRGNITNVKDKDEVVLGYINVSTATQKRIYISIKDLNIYKSGSNCSRALYNVSEWGAVYASGLLPVSYGVTEQGEIDMNNAFWAKAACVDCNKAGGTQNKPSFWPQTH